MCFPWFNRYCIFKTWRFDVMSIMKSLEILKLEIFHIITQKIVVLLYILSMCFSNMVMRRCSQDYTCFFAFLKK